MTGIWVTPGACSECFRHHDDVDYPDSYDPDCDCWCHDRDDEENDDDGPW